MKINAQRFPPTFCCPCVPPTDENYPHSIMLVQEEIYDMYEAGEDPSIYQLARLARKNGVRLTFCLGVIAALHGDYPHPVD